MSGQISKHIDYVNSVRIDGLSARSRTTPFPIHEAPRSPLFCRHSAAGKHGRRSRFSGLGETGAAPAGAVAWLPTLQLEDLDLGDAKIAENVRRAKRILGSDIPVLIHGETGTGKVLFAKAMHNSDDGSHKPFVAVNCASLPKPLIESELFGYQSGALSGASRQGRRGKILQANRGTLFLDEISDMPLQLEARLLRVLEEREVSPLGSESCVKVDFRLISATHQNLEELIDRGKFREDLYYRLLGMSICLPALRERGDKRNLIRQILSRKLIARRWKSTRTRCGSWSITIGPAISASCATACAPRWRYAKAMPSQSGTYRLIITHGFAIAAIARPADKRFRAQFPGIGRAQCADPGPGAVSLENYQSCSQIECQPQYPVSQNEASEHQGPEQIIAFVSSLP